MKNLKIGIIGCGKQAVKHLACLKNLPNIDITCADTDKNAARNLGQREKVQWTASPEEIFSDKSVNAVVICTPTPTHIAIIEKAVNNSKHVFCEKPLTDSVEGAEQLKNSIDGSDRIIMMGYVYRFVPIMVEAYNLFQKYAIDGVSLAMGRPLVAHFRLGGRGGHQLWKHQRMNGGGAINEMLAHMVDLANWYFGPLSDLEVTNCKTIWPKRPIADQEVQVDAEDYVAIQCKGKDGVEIFCQADLLTPAFCQYIEIQAENGSFMGSIQPDMPSYLFLKDKRGGYNAGKTNLSYGLRNVLELQMATFIQNVVRNSKPDINTITDSLELLQVMSQIRQKTKASL